MATINLIPERIKKEQALSRVISMVSTFLFLLLIMGAIVFSALFLANMINQSELTKEEQALADQELKNEALKSIGDDVGQINSKLAKITTIKGAALDTNDLLTKVNSSIPERVKVLSFQYDRATKKMTISGAADSRRDIVKLETKLGSIGYFSNLAFSTSSYSEEGQTYNFNMTGDITK